MANVEACRSKRRRSDFQTINLAALLAALLCPLLQAESPGDRVKGVYRGTIGRQQIVVEFSKAFTYEYGTNFDDPDDSRTYPISGSYFYRRYAVSIHLAGMPLPDGSLLIREYLKPGFLPYEFPAEWRLTLGRNGATGTFCKCDLSGPGKPAKPVLKITLTRISNQPPPPEQWEHYRPHSGNTYYDLLLDYPLELGPETQAGSTTAYRMRTDPRFSISRPELTHFPNRRTMASINAGLTAEFNQTRLDAASCFTAGRMGGAFGGWYSETIKLILLPPYFLGVLVQSSCYSGGAHPNEGIYTLNYDLRTGRAFTLKDSFRAPEGEDPELEMAAVLANLYQRHYVEPPPVQTPEDCDVVLLRNTSGNVSLKNAFSPSHAKLFLTKKGLVIIPIFATRPEMGCAPAITVPYRELRPYVDKGTLLYQVLTHYEITRSGTTRELIEVTHCLKAGDLDWLADSPPLDTAKWLRVGIIHDSRTYPGKDVIFAVVLENPTTGDVFELTRHTDKTHREYTIENNGSFKLERSRFEWPNEILGGIWTHEYVERNVRKITRGPKTWVSVKRILPPITSASCGSYVTANAGRQ